MRIMIVSSMSLIVIDSINKGNDGFKMVKRFIDEDNEWINDVNGGTYKVNNWINE